MKASNPLPTLGWREWIALPELGIAAVKAKVDTGARSSALHAENVRIVDVEGKRVVRFVVVPLQHSNEGSCSCEAELHDQRWVRSSNGTRELRPVIRATVGWGGETWQVDLTLTARDVMGFRMLFGREAIRDRFLVHAGRSYLGGRRKRRKDSLGPNRP